MTATSKPFLELCAGELMSPEVVMISQEMSLQGAARLLSRAQVGGAPVVDAAGRCVGVLSSADFLHWVEGGQQTGNNPEKQCMCSAWQIVETEKLPECLVADVMTKDPVTMGTEVHIADLARTMVDAHIHRVIIVDRKQRPIGIVSSTDILAALTRADFHRNTHREEWAAE